MKDRDRVAPELEKVSRNIIDRYEELGMSVSVPDLRYFFDWNNDGIAGNEINDNADVSLSQSEVAFDKDGGVATVTVTTNIPLTLEKNGYGDTMPDGPIFSENTYLNDFFTDEGRTMECERTYEDNILTIKVAKTEKRNVQTATIPLYDYMGVCQATVNVTLAGDPSIELKLGENGKQIVAATFAQFAKAISWMCYVEQGYTGMSQYFDVKCPMTPADTYNRNAFNAAYAAVARNANFAKTLESYGYYPAVPFFQLLNAILYTEMVDKWRRVGISESVKDDFDIPVQRDAEYTLRYLEARLDEISGVFTDKKADMHLTTPESVFDMSKDIWRVAKANVCLALGNYAEAMSCLQQIADSGRYALDSGNEYEPGDGTIMHLIVADEVMQGHSIGYYSYADVLLALAECNIVTGNDAKASVLIRQVAEAKDMTVCGNNIDDIAKLRRQLFIPRYFAFQKRNNLGGYEDYQHCWPIPYDQILSSHTWTQNPGYEK